MLRPNTLAKFLEKHSSLSLNWYITPIKSCRPFCISSQLAESFTCIQCEDHELFRSISAVHICIRYYRARDLKWRCITKPNDYLDAFFPGHIFINTHTHSIVMEYPFTEFTPRKLIDWHRHAKNAMHLRFVCTTVCHSTEPYQNETVSVCFRPNFVCNIILLIDNGTQHIQLKCDL